MIKLTKSTFLFILAIFLCSCNAGKMAYKKGIKRFTRGEHQLAIDEFTKALNKSYFPSKSSLFIAESYRLSNRIHLAAPFYEAAIEAGNTDEDAYFYYAFALKSVGKYTEAQEQLKQYLKTATNSSFITRAESEIENLRKLRDIPNNEKYIKIKNLGGINTEAAEYAPVYNEGSLFFTSSRGEGKIFKSTGTAFTNIYQATLDNKNRIDISSIRMLSDVINTENINEGTLTFTRKGAVMVFARGNTGKKKGTQDVNLYITYFRNNEWTKPVMLSISNPNAWDSCPAFSKNGRTLYFASNRDGGYGGIDLYSSKIDGSGRWSEAKNLGKEINTQGDEMFPYVSSNGKLYFASNGHPGLGGLDLFVATRVNGKVEVENMGTPINSSFDDFAINYQKAPFEGFFSSNRTDGKGDDDIYFFIDNSPSNKIVHYRLEISVVTLKEDSTEIPVPEAAVRLYQEEEVLEQGETNETGTFTIDIGIEENYVIKSRKKGYFLSSNTYSTIGKSIPKEELTQRETTVTFKTKLYLQPIVLDKAIVLENIYYDFDKADIRPDAAKELDRLVKILKENPQISIELSSHTDSRGEDDYNLDLSQRRAESAVKYIISKGIEAKRIVAKGYGETKPVKPNAETEEEHEMNRRTEFKVTKIDSAVLDQLENTENAPQDY